MTTPYRSVTFTGEQVSKQKMQQLANNVQWLYENTPRIRYKAWGVTRETGIKVLGGISTYQASKYDWSNVNIYFGSFFTAGCRPLVVATVTDSTYGSRKYVVARGFNGPLDHTGFLAHVVQYEPAGHPKKIRGGGRISWIAIGY